MSSCLQKNLVLALIYFKPNAKFLFALLGLILIFFIRGAPQINNISTRRILYFVPMLNR